MTKLGRSGNKATQLMQQALEKALGNASCNLSQLDGSEWKFEAVVVFMQLMSICWYCLFICCYCLYTVSLGLNCLLQSWRSLLFQNLDSCSSMLSRELTHEDRSRNKFYHAPMHAGVNVLIRTTYPIYILYIIYMYMYVYILFLCAPGKRTILPRKWDCSPIIRLSSREQSTLVPRKILAAWTLPIASYVIISKPMNKHGPNKSHACTSLTKYLPAMKVVPVQWQAYWPPTAWFGTRAATSWHSWPGTPCPHWTRKSS